LQQTGLAVGILAMILYLFTLIVSLLLHNPLGFHPFWTAGGGLFIAERVVTVYRGGWPGILLAFPLIMEMFYDFFQMAIYVVSIVNIAFKREAQWHHVAVSQ
jgi:hypothetical protein